MRWVKERLNRMNIYKVQWFKGDRIEKGKERSFPFASWWRIAAQAFVVTVL